MTGTIRTLPAQSRNFPGWWEGRSSAFPAEFVKFVEEHREKAA